jgi:hypothetical protein
MRIEVAIEEEVKELQPNKETNKPSMSIPEAKGKKKRCPVLESNQ